MRSVFSSAYDTAGRPSVSEVRLKSAEKMLELDFDDGKSFRFSAEFLRVESPSAEVQGHGPDQRIFVPGKRHVAITGVEPVGTYALRLTFDDLHDTGIYSWEYFYNHGLEQDRLWNEYLRGLKEQRLSRDPR